MVSAWLRVALKSRKSSRYRRKCSVLLSLALKKVFVEMHYFGDFASIGTIFKKITGTISRIFYDL